MRMHEWSERELLPLVRTFLLGYFGELRIQISPFHMLAISCGKQVFSGCAYFTCRILGSNLNVATF